MKINIAWYWTWWVSHTGENKEGTDGLSVLLMAPPKNLIFFTSSYYSHETRFVFSDLARPLQKKFQWISASGQSHHCLHWIPLEMVFPMANDQFHTLLNYCYDLLPEIKKNLNYCCSSNWPRMCLEKRYKQCVHIVSGELSLQKLRDLGTIYQ